MNKHFKLQNTTSQKASLYAITLTTELQDQITIDQELFGLILMFHKVYSTGNDGSIRHNWVASSTQLLFKLKNGTEWQ